VKAGKQNSVRKSAGKPMEFSANLANHRSGLIT